MINKKSKGLGLIQTLLRSFIILLICSNTFSVSAQDDSEDKMMLQYLFPQFDSCQVKLKSGKITNVIANYNNVTEKMVFIKDDTRYDMTNTANIDTVTIEGRQFVPVEDVFYEIVVNKPIGFYIQNRSDLNRLGQPGAYGSRSYTTSVERITTIQQNNALFNFEIPEDYVITPSSLFWIKRDQTMYSFMNKRQLLKIFPEKSNELKQFIDRNHLKTEDRDDMIKLVNYCNELIK